MFWKNFYSLCSDRGKSPNGVAKELSIASGTITAWKNGKVPHHGTLLKLAEYFGVSVDYLLGNEPRQKEKPADDGGLSEAERLLIELLRQIPEERREMVIQMIRAALGSP